jgi:hypothetical protein
VRLRLLITSSIPARCIWPKAGDNKTCICHWPCCVRGLLQVAAAAPEPSIAPRRVRRRAGGFRGRGAKARSRACGRASGARVAPRPLPRTRSGTGATHQRRTEVSSRHRVPPAAVARARPARRAVRRDQSTAGLGLPPSRFRRAARRSAGGFRG